MKKENLILVMFLLALLTTSLYIHTHLTETASLAMASAVKDTRSEVELPVLMYHGITEDPARVDEYFILASDFEKDLKWLADHGYTTVSFQQLVNYVENGARLPSRPILLTFDDGYYNNYSLAFPLLQKYNARAVISPIGIETDLSSSTIYRPETGGSITWAEAAKLSASGLVEIGNHSYNLHRNDSGNGGRKGADRLPGESYEDYRAVLLDDLGKSQSRIEASAGQPALVFAWPFGAWPTDGSANCILKELGFKGSLTSYQIMNTLTAGNPDSLFGLKRFLRVPDFLLEEKLTP